MHIAQKGLLSNSFDVAAPDLLVVVGVSADLPPETALRFNGPCRAQEFALPTQNPRDVLPTAGGMWTLLLPSQPVAFGGRLFGP